MGPEHHLLESLWKEVRDEFLVDDFNVKRRKASPADCKAAGVDAPTRGSLYFYDIHVFPQNKAGHGQELLDSVSD